LRFLADGDVDSASSGADAPVAEAAQPEAASGLPSPHFFRFRLAASATGIAAIAEAWAIMPPAGALCSCAQADVVMALARPRSTGAPLLEGPAVIGVIPEGAGMADPALLPGAVAWTSEGACWWSSVAAITPPPATAKAGELVAPTAQGISALGDDDAASTGEVAIGSEGEAKLAGVSMVVESGELDGDGEAAALVVVVGFGWRTLHGTPGAAVEVEA
jgi:hypothetical protein